MNQIKKIVSHIKLKYGWHAPTSDDLLAAIRNLGYTIIEFNPSYNNDSVNSLVLGLNLQHEITKYKAFTYHDANYRLVFIRGHLSEDEKRILLSHELGHIELGHFGKNILMGQNIQHEWEANEFSHYLLHTNIFSKLYYGIKKHSNKVIIISSVILFIAILFTALFMFSAGKADDYYVTASGERYHRENCYYIQNRDVRKITKEEIESGAYSPCKVCFPDKQ